MTTVKLNVVEATSLKELVGHVNKALEEGWSLRGDIRTEERRAEETGKRRTLDVWYCQVLAWVAMVEAADEPPKV